MRTKLALVRTTACAAVVAVMLSGGLSSAHAVPESQADPVCTTEWVGGTGGLVNNKVSLQLTCTSVPAGYAVWATAFSTGYGGGSTWTTSTLRGAGTAMSDSHAISVGLTKRSEPQISWTARARDRVVLGDPDSELGYDVSATGGGTGTEAGHSRRYTGTEADGSFSAKLFTAGNSNMSLTVMETYDKPRTRVYEVLVNGVVVHTAGSPHSGPGLREYTIPLSPRFFTGQPLTITIRNIAATAVPGNSDASIHSLRLDSATCTGRDDC